ncbi:MAG TPA: hypothetical protein VLA67_06625 [Nitrospiraceae bacterium]|nr:hypothetical protein [Nitrospiraceae bacterium]
MARSSLQKRLSFPQNDAAEAEETGHRGTGATPQSLLYSPESGMIVFSSSARVLYMNGPARALMALFGKYHERWPQMAPESMPSILTEFCCEVLEQLRRRIEAQDWVQFEIRRICHMVTPSILITGFGVPNSSNREIRIILTLTPLLSRPRTVTDSRHFHQSAETHTPASA